MRGNSLDLAIIGTGNVGATLGRLWAAQGHTVVFGARNPESTKLKGRLDRSIPSASATDMPTAAARAEVVVLAIPFPAARAVLEEIGDLSGKILIDCTNPLSPGLQGLSLGHVTSASEEIARWTSNARVVKAFNTVGADNLAHPTFGDQAATMFICGDDLAAKAVVTGLAESLGFEVVDAGPLTTARLLEPLAALWIHLAYRQGLGPDIAIKLIRREEGNATSEGDAD